MLVTQLEEASRAEVENQYTRSVSRLGNMAAQKIMAEVFEVTDRKWRGLGMIPQSGCGCARSSATMTRSTSSAWRGRRREPAECIGAQVLQGMKKLDCAAFGVRCTPESPLGAPMVSNEGACAAYYLPARISIRTSPLSAPQCPLAWIW